VLFGPLTGIRVASGGVGDRGSEARYDHLSS